MEVWMSGRNLKQFKFRLVHDEVRGIPDVNEVNRE